MVYKQCILIILLYKEQAGVTVNMRAPSIQEFMQSSSNAAEPSCKIPHNILSSVP